MVPKLRELKCPNDSLLKVFIENLKRVVIKKTLPNELNNAFNKQTKFQQIIFYAVMEVFAISVSA